MSSSLIQIEADKRQILGKKVAARRRAGFIPANIVSKGKDSLAIEISTTKLIKALEKSGYTQALEIIVGDEKITALVTKVTFAPTADLPEHVVFFEVKKGELVHASVPVILTGEAPGEQKGLMILQMLHQLEVISPALKIPEQLEVDISDLEENGDGIRVEEINLPEEIETELDPNTLVVKLEIPRSQVAEEEAEAEDEGAETEEDSDEEDKQETSSAEETE